MESAYLAPYKSAALVIGLQIETVTWAYGEGLKVAAVSMVGFQIGAGDIRKAKHIKKLILAQTFAFALVISTLIFTFNQYLVQAYTDNLQIKQVFNDYALALVCLLSADLVLSVLFGLFKALGKQIDLLLPSLVCCYFIGLPVGNFLCFQV